MKLPRALFAFIVAIVVAGVFALTVACGGNGQPSAATPAQTETPAALAPEITPTALLRLARSLCVDAAGGATLSQSAVANLEEALVLFREDLAGRPYEETVLSRGCPPPAAQDPANRYGKPPPDRGPFTVQGPTTLTPSEHRVHVYFVPNDTLHDWFGNVPYGQAGEEMFCGDPPRHNCAGVTSGLYIAPGLGADAIRKALRETFGLGSSFDPLLGPGY